MAKAPQKQQDSLDIDLVRTALQPDYVILEELGRGGMAVVYRARERALDREVAIKVLPSFMAMDSAFVERFQHEARTAGQLEHPNIVPIYRVGRKNKVIYFVMKLLRGTSLAAVLRQRVKLTVPEVRRILIDTAGALGYAARRNVVHRDIKPDNILLDDEGRCVVTDFGIAKSSGGPLTAAGTSMGTPSYMSPEHARGVQLDGRSDMYSLGVVAYQCLTGTTPYQADDPFAILYKHINDPLPHPALSTTEEHELYAVIEKMLAKNPEDRFQTADELISALGGTPQSSAPTLIAAGGAASGPTTTKARMSGLSRTELIGTATFGTRIRRLANDRRAWAGAGVLVLAVVVAVWPRLRLSSSEVPPPVVGASAAGSATRPISGTTSGATTRAVAPVGDTTAARLATKTDSVPTSPASVTKIAAPPVASRTGVARDAASKCPRTVPRGTYLVLVDSVRPQKPGAKLTVNYDVCGLSTRTPISTTLKFRKLNQRFRRQDDRLIPYPEVVSSQRSRHRKIVELAGLSDGRYALDVLVRDAQGREKGSTVLFQILER